jgi:hypothetical protein
VRAVAGDRVEVLVADFGERRLVGDRTIDERRIEPGGADDLRVHLGYVRLDAVEEERVTDRRVPTIQLFVAELAPDHRADAHLAEAERPRPFPGMAFAGDQVDLLE